MKIKDLLNETKNALGISSDGELARSLDVSKQSVSDYYNGKRSPDEFACLKIAQAIKKPLETVIAQVRAESEKDEKRRQTWENYIKRLDGLAASCFGIVILVQNKVENALELALLNP